MCQKLFAGLICLVFTFLFWMPALAQPTNEKGWYQSKDLENVEMGWMNTINYKGPVKPHVKDGWNYPVSQIEQAIQLGTWLMEAYKCNGVLGEIKLSVLAPPLSDWPKGSMRQLSDDNRFALPNTYGAYARFHQCISRTEKHKFWPTQGNWCYQTLNIMANNLERVTNQVVELSSMEEYYCTMPTYTAGEKGNYDTEWMPKYLHYGDFTNSVRLKNYQHYIRPDTREYILVMTKDRKPLPLEQVTVGDYLNRLETQFPVLLKLTEGSPVANRAEAAKKGLQLLKEKYKHQLNEFVYFSSANPKVELADLSYVEKDKGTDLFYTEAVSKAVNNGYSSRGEHTNYPLLRLKKGVKTDCATGGPQWIVFSLDTPFNESYGGTKNLWDVFVSRFNYDYLYQFYFGSQKPAAGYTSH